MVVATHAARMQLLHPHEASLEQRLAQAARGEHGQVPAGVAGRARAVAIGEQAAGRPHAGVAGGVEARPGVDLQRVVAAALGVHEGLGDAQRIGHPHLQHTAGAQHAQHFGQGLAGLVPGHVLQHMGHVDQVEAGILIGQAAQDLGGVRAPGAHHVQHLEPGQGLHVRSDIKLAGHSRGSPAGERLAKPAMHA